jgi:hypothetical protein
MTFRQGASKFAEALLLPINPAVVVLLGVYTVLWGFWVANPWWTVFTRAGLYSELSEVTFSIIPPEVLWGGIAMLCGAVTIYGAIKRSYKSLILGASVIGWHWLMIAIFYFLGDPASTGGITALLMAVYGAFLWLNVKINFKEHKDIDDVLG